MYEVIAMVKQLGIPTWFMKLSCADLRWPELFQIVARTQGKNLTDEQVQALSYVERCQMLNANPVVVAKHFQHRVETFFREVLLSNINPIGKISYYALRVEFQMRGSPHLHLLIWASDCPKLTSESKDAYVQYVDQHVQKQTFLMKIMNQSCMSWSKCIRSTTIQKPAENTKMLAVVSILGNFLPNILLWLNSLM